MKFRSTVWIHISYLRKEKQLLHRRLIHHPRTWQSHEEKPPSMTQQVGELRCLLGEAPWQSGFQRNPSGIITVKWGWSLHCSPLTEDQPIQLGTKFRTRREFRISFPFTLALIRTHEVNGSKSSGSRPSFLPAFSFYGGGGGGRAAAWGDKLRPSRFLTLQLLETSQGLKEHSLLIRAEICKRARLWPARELRDKRPTRVSFRQ